MPQRIAKLMLPLTCACMLAMAAVPAMAAAKSRLTVGISDNSPAMFSSNWFNRINLTVARDIVPWNAAIMRDKSQLRAARIWVHAALADHVQPMIVFGGDINTTSNAVPNTRRYSYAVRTFMRDIPQVRVYTPWNEPDWIYRPGLAYHPALAASYYNVVRRYCRGCTVVAGDLYLPAGQLGPWIRSYERYLRYRPAVWGLHNYYDVRTQTLSQLRTMMRLTRGQIWLTEISGVERRGHWPYPNQTVKAAARDEAFLFSLGRFRRVTRIYHYQWQGTRQGPNTGWDSGLLNPNGWPRPAYKVVAREAGWRRG